MSSRGDINRALLDVGEERLARMDAAGVAMEVLSVTTPGTQPLPAVEAAPLAREANDFLADAVRRHPDRFAAFATLPTPDATAAADELRRAVTELGHVGAMLFPRTGDVFLDDDRFRPIFEAAAELRVPLYIHPALPPRQLRTIAYGGFDQWTSMILGTGGWGWHAEAGLATLRLILSGTFDRHPDLQVVLGHWGEMLVPFADRADLLSGAARHLERRVLDYITGNVHVTAGGVFSHRMLRQAVDVLGADRVMFGQDDPYGRTTGTAGEDSRGRFSGSNGARIFVQTAPLSPEDRTKLAHANAERLFRLPTA
ncbi:amidohydrolase family protein [Modestobacter sp. VKM Ac-2979]|uniref:amidohydrolase family protein n=1 Tax=unclassified Modestobacter TaxID=2643866 RepID=UPI0022ABAD0E|nr:MULTISPECIES: amidohydrolase family protein [unclassified Modestobacter]MCZ2811942.1 amidohydrolase family protein [Modestobacter sp. VKM Ac-2979]MCZ2843665.1 amidohydrolase family protein [Modestobacter sp. VKM Ac-2980]